MNGNIECAFTGRVGTKPEIQAVGCASPSLMFCVAVGTQWIRVGCFGDAARVGEALRLGDHVYIEGIITLQSWEHNGEPRSGLSVATLRCEKLRNIGRNNPPEPDPHAPPIILVVPEDDPLGEPQQIEPPDDMPCPY